MIIVTAGKISRQTCYCPLDLYSRDRKRVLRALREMAKVSQNVFRLFFNNGRRSKRVTLPFAENNMFGAKTKARQAHTW